MNQKTATLCVVAFALCGLCCLGIVGTGTVVMLGRDRQPDPQPVKIPPGGLKVKYLNRDAEHWARLLMDADEELSRQAAVAMERIGDESIPFALEAARTSPISHVKIHAMNIGTSVQHKANLKAWAPIYRASLKDADNSVRQTATLKIYETRCAECYQDLVDASRVERDGFTKTSMDHCLKLLQLK